MLVRERGYLRSLMTKLPWIWFWFTPTKVKASFRGGGNWKTIHFSHNSKIISKINVHVFFPGAVGKWWWFMMGYMRKIPTTVLHPSNSARGVRKKSNTCCLMTCIKLGKNPVTQVYPWYHHQSHLYLFPRVSSSQHNILKHVTQIPLAGVLLYSVQ